MLQHGLIVLLQQNTYVHLQKSLQGATTSSIDVQGVFDRWEGRIVSEEYDVPTEISDSLSSSFEQS